jgi:peptidoglycan/LPS O-acetylase OafA/YrhL
MIATAQPPMAIYKFTVTRIDGLALGGAAALVVRDERLLARVTPLLSRTLLATGGLLLALFPVTRGFSGSTVLVETLGFSALSVFFAALVLRASIDPDARMARRLSVPWLRWLGKYSYAIYVFHLPIWHLLAPGFAPTINGPAAGAALGAFTLLEASVAALSILAALASWNLFERRALSLKDRLAPRVAQGNAKA